MKTRDRIIHSATELFNDQGERNITTNHIAAHLGISPGNLYYHFRNKEDIIHSIFDQYARHLSESFTPARSNEIKLENLMGYLDAIFYLMWQFRFFYANLPDILSRDEPLQQKYLKAQEQLRSSVVALLRSLREGGIIDVNDEDLPDLGQTIKMVVTCWIPFQIARPPIPASPSHCSTRGYCGCCSCCVPISSPRWPGRSVSWSSITVNWPNQQGEICFTIVDKQLQ